MLCIECKQYPPKKGAVRFCSHKCQHDHQYRVFIGRWLQNLESGLIVDGSVSDHIRRWLRETRGNKCELCWWAKVNPVTGLVPVQIDHINGDGDDNRPENLRLLCPNCHSLTPTYMALNKGHGKTYRRKYEIRRSGFVGEAPTS